MTNIPTPEQIREITNVMRLEGNIIAYHIDDTICKHSDICDNARIVPTFNE